MAYTKYVSVIGFIWSLALSIRSSRLTPMQPGMSVSIPTPERYNAKPEQAAPASPCNHYQNRSFIILCKPVFKSVRIMSLTRRKMLSAFNPSFNRVRIWSFRSDQILTRFKDAVKSIPELVFLFGAIRAVRFDLEYNHIAWDVFTLCRNNNMDEMKLNWKTLVFSIWVIFGATKNSISYMFSLRCTRFYLSLCHSSYCINR